MNTKRTRKTKYAYCPIPTDLVRGDIIELSDGSKRTFIVWEDHPRGRVCISGVQPGMLLPDGRPAHDPDGDFPYAIGIHRRTPPAAQDPDKPADLVPLPKLFGPGSIVVDNHGVARMAVCFRKKEQAWRCTTEEGLCAMFCENGERLNPQNGYAVRVLVGAQVLDKDSIYLKGLAASHANKYDAFRLRYIARRLELMKALQPR